MSVAVGARGVLRAPVNTASWLFGDNHYDVAADFTVVEVLAGSVKVEIGEVSGVPRNLRAAVTEILEGWHSLAELGITSARRAVPAPDSGSVGVARSGGET